MQFWKDYNIYDGIKNLVWTWGNVTKKCMNDIWKKTLKRFYHNFKEFAKDGEVAKINKAAIEMPNNFNLGVDENVIEEPLKIVPEKMSNEKLLELEQECIAQEEIGHGLNTKSYKIREILDRLCLEEEGKKVSRTEGNIDDSFIGGNASAAGPEGEDTESTVITCVDIS
ncbi:hypothetical protein QTO34_017804 [Cnephaeus nilssonii]|uniref:TCTP domain-containing protein n=1 Tax=Cnephaeus nilssonii TaxID=3371016 RepID=A0AA40LRL1_CNENI|nr:hypothetical protein QTO34_017804 [Eptesicus nilssonii]